jgi:hypothetical protein
VSRRLRAVVVLTVTTICSVELTGCATEYRGPSSGIDGVLWRQVASIEDPLVAEIYQPSTQEPEAYLDALGQPVWDGRDASVPDLGLGDGGGVLYDVEAGASAVGFSVFIASGPRADEPTDSGGRYGGPGEVFTCYRYEVEFGAPSPAAGRTVLDDCPPVLVDELADDAAFASAEVFDG